MHCSQYLVDLDLQQILVYSLYIILLSSEILVMNCIGLQRSCVVNKSVRNKKTVVILS